eukprot:symbB.v1.2.017343.t1/scaffold1353.1/size123746/5
MDFRAAELWSHAPSIVEKLDVAIKQSSAAAKEDLLTVLGIDTGPQVTVEETKAGIEDFEYALQAAVLQRLEEPDADVKEVPRIIELAAECVCALYERASVPDVGVGSPMARMALVESTKLSGLHGEAPLEDAESVAGTESSHGSSDGSEGHELKKNPRDPEDVGGIPSKIPRHCTDVHWIFLYFLFSAVVVAIAAYVFPGEPEALLKLADWRGEKCGLSRNRGKPYLYFCPSEHDPDRLQMWYPICVSSCPQAEMITNGGLPYPPYPVPDAYARYPPQNVFSEQPYLHPQVSYPPPMYPPPPPGGPWKTPWHPEGSTETGETSEPSRRLDGGQIMPLGLKIG